MREREKERERERERGKNKVLARFIDNLSVSLKPC